VKCDQCAAKLMPKEIHLNSDRLLCANCDDSLQRASMMFPSIMPALPQAPAVGAPSPAGPPSPTSTQTQAALPSSPNSLSSNPNSSPSVGGSPSLARPSVNMRIGVVPRRLPSTNTPSNALTTVQQSVAASPPPRPSAVTPTQIPPKMDADLDDAIEDELARLEMEQARKKV